MKFGILVSVAAATIAMGCTQKETVVQKVEPKKEDKIIQDSQELVIDVNQIRLVLGGEVAEPEGTPNLGDLVNEVPVELSDSLFSRGDINISVNDGITSSKLKAQSSKLKAQSSKLKAQSSKLKART